MKILHYSDIGVNNFLELYKKAEVLVTTGDLYAGDFAGLEEEVNKKPAFGVYGNHDSGTYMEQLGITNLHNRWIEYQGWKWGGWQGCLRYKKGDLMFDEDAAEKFADTFPPVDVLLLHAGPRGMLDDVSDDIHKGSENIRRYVLEKKPKLIFCGHQYSDGEMVLQKTKIYRTYGARIVEVDLRTFHEV